MAAKTSKMFKARRKEKERERRNYYPNQTQAAQDQRGKLRHNKGNRIEVPGTKHTPRETRSEKKRMRMGREKERERYDLTILLSRTYRYETLSPPFHPLPSI